MITEKRLVLIANDVVSVETLRKQFNYEAIRLIKNIDEVEPTWALNKTPLMLKADLPDASKAKYPMLKIPEELCVSSTNEEFIKFCHENGFECGEYITGKKHDTSKDYCFLCDIGRRMGMGGPLENYVEKTKIEADIIIYDSPNFYIKIEWGCLKKGMVMICPKRHLMSAASIPDEQMEEYEQVAKDIQYLLKRIYGNEPVIYFEHGSAPDGYSSHERSIVHAHVHVAWGVKFDEKFIKMVAMHPVNNIKDARGRKYMSYQEGCDGQLWVVDDPRVYVQRQFPRQVIGYKLGIPNELTNWRKEPFAQNMTDTFHDFHAFLSENWEELPERIRKATNGFFKGYPKRKEY